MRTMGDCDHCHTCASCFPEAVYVVVFDGLERNQRFFMLFGSGPVYTDTVYYICLKCHFLQVCIFFRFRAAWSVFACEELVKLKTLISFIRNPCLCGYCFSQLIHTHIAWPTVRNRQFSVVNCSLTWLRNLVQSHGTVKLNLGTSSNFARLLTHCWIE